MSELVIKEFDNKKVGFLKNLKRFFLNFIR